MCFLFFFFWVCFLWWRLFVNLQILSYGWWYMMQFFSSEEWVNSDCYVFCCGDCYSYNFIHLVYGFILVSIFATITQPPLRYNFLSTQTLGF
jgi:hypothetical protein